MEILLNREVVLSKNINRVFGVAVFVVLMSLAAFVRVPLPFTPVPVTLQTFFVLLSGACLGGSLGAASQLIYLILGIAGVSVFTGLDSGVFYFAGATGGYIFGFILAALFIGKVLKPAQMSVRSVIWVFSLAEVILFASGVLWLKLLFNYNLLQLFIVGVLPFIPGEMLKIIVCAGIYSKIQSRCKKIF